MMMFGTVRRWFYGLSAAVGFVLYRLWKRERKRREGAEQNERAAQRTAEDQRAARDKQQTVLEKSRDVEERNRRSTADERRERLRGYTDSARNPNRDAD